ncbi:hypothetical protein TWF696_002676 [Orbilia brochopaga]|uniref:Uncharacterized protein n=1 Tax=Orbilia brochopaga TaxID=3140254 RepID=A0AAV9U2U8_9PEZI
MVINVGSMLELLQDDLDHEFVALWPGRKTCCGTADECNIMPDSLGVLLGMKAHAHANEKTGFSPAEKSSACAAILHGLDQVTTDVCASLARLITIESNGTGKIKTSRRLSNELGLRF